MSTNAFTKSLSILLLCTVAAPSSWIGTAFGQDSGNDTDRAIDRFRNKNRPAYRLYKGKMNEELDRDKLNLPQTKKKMQLKSDPLAGLPANKGIGPEGDFVPEEIPRKMKKPEPLIKSADWQLEREISNASSLEDSRFDEEQEDPNAPKEKILDFDNLATEMINQDLEGAKVEDGNLELDPETQAEQAENLAQDDPSLDPELENGFTPNGSRKDGTDEDDASFKPALSGTLVDDRSGSADPLASNLSDAELESMVNEANDAPLGSVVEDNSLVVGSRPQDEDADDDVYLGRSKEVMDALVQPHKEARDARYERKSGMEAIRTRYEDKRRSLTNRYTPGAPKPEVENPNSAVVSISAADRVQESRMGLLRDTNQFNPGTGGVGNTSFAPSTNFKPTSDVEFGGSNGLAGLNNSNKGSFGSPFGNGGNVREPSTPGILKIPNMARGPVEPNLPKIGGGFGNAPSVSPTPMPSFREQRREGLRIKSSLGNDRPTFPLGNRSGF